MTDFLRQATPPRFPAYLTGGAAPLLTGLRPEISAAPVGPSAHRGLHAVFDRLCKAHLGAEVETLTDQGWQKGASIRLNLSDGRKVIATRRDDSARAALEAEALTRLSEAGAPVPAPLFWNGVVLLQEHVAGPRLDQRVGPRDIRKTLGLAVESLADLHARASSAGMDGFGPLLGCGEDWLYALIDHPRLLALYLNVPEPEIECDRIFQRLICMEPRFVRWDARPRNSIRAKVNSVTWFGFDYCGARHRLDDLMWLLGDESLPDDPTAEDALLKKALPDFADGRTADDAMNYAMIYGTFHCAARLGVLLARKGGLPWRQETASLDQAETLCRRAARWADRAEETRPLAQWWRDMLEAVSTLDPAQVCAPVRDETRKALMQR